MYGLVHGLMNGFYRGLNRDYLYRDYIEDERVKLYIYASKPWVLALGFAVQDIALP